MLAGGSLRIRGSRNGVGNLTKPFDRLIQYARLVLLLQLGISLLAAGIAFFYAGRTGLFSALAGGVAALMSTLISLRRARLAGELAETSPNATMATLYWGFFQKVAILCLIVLVGWKLLELNPLILFATLGAAQLAYTAPLIRA